MLTEHKYFLTIDRLTLNQLTDQSLADLVQTHFGLLPIQANMVRKIIDNEQGQAYCYVDLFEIPE